MARKEEIYFSEFASALAAAQNATQTFLLVAALSLALVMQFTHFECKSRKERPCINAFEFSYTAKVFFVKTTKMQERQIKLRVELSREDFLLPSRSVLLFLLSNEKRRENER